MGCRLSKGDGADRPTMGPHQPLLDSSAPSPPGDPSPQPSPLSLPNNSCPNTVILHQISVLDKPFQSLSDHYCLREELAEDTSYRSPTYRCIEKSTNKAYACKIFFKLLKLLDPRADVKRQIEIRKYLSGQPNIVEFKDAFEDNDTVSIVMELCSRNGIFDLISCSEFEYTERAIASIIRDIVNAVKACHDMNVMHGDIRPERFLLSCKDEGPVLKAFDFRHSRVMEQGKKFCYSITISYYLAPEVLKGSYGKEIDIWSVGVILYMLLSGEPPFYAGTKAELKQLIKHGEIDFDSQPWQSVSYSAKQLIDKMLTVNPQQRISPKEVLDFPWISGGEASDKPMDGTVLTRLKRFRERDNLM